jgi:hypothetical protein
VRRRGHLRSNNHGIHTRITLQHAHNSRYLKSRAGTAAREYAQRYYDGRRSDTDVFRWLEQLLREAGSLTPTGTIECRSPTDCMNSSQWRCPNCCCREAHTISHKNWCYPYQESSKYYKTINCIHATICRSMSVSRRSSSTDAILWMAVTISHWKRALFTQHYVGRQVMSYVWGCVQRPQVTYEHG